MNASMKQSDLRNIPLFYSLDRDQLRNISGKIIVKPFKKNEIILPEKDSNEFMYIILSGKAKVYHVTEDGREIILAMHRRGDYFGEMSLIDGKTVPANVSAVQDTITAIISKKAFYSLIYGQRKILDNLLKILCSRLRESWSRVKILSFGTATQRMKGLLALLLVEYGEKTHEGFMLNLKLTHQDIADMTGLSRETVTRIINRWQKEDKIKLLKDRRICINTDFLRLLSHI